MTPYYVVKNGHIVPKPRTLGIQPRFSIDSSQYTKYIDAKNYSVSSHKENDAKPMYIVDVDFGGNFTIFCEHFGELLTVMALFANLFPRQGQHRK